MLRVHCWQQFLYVVLKAPLQEAVKRRLDISQLIMDYIVCLHQTANMLTV
jgi:hypothetical protein